MGKNPQKGLPGPQKHHPTGSSPSSASPSIQALRRHAVPNRARGALGNHRFHSWGTFAWLQILKNQSPQIKVESSRVDILGVTKNSHTLSPRHNHSLKIRQFSKNRCSKHHAVCTFKTEAAILLGGIWMSPKFRLRGGWVMQSGKAHKESFVASV